MKNLICSLVLSASVFYIGCQKEEENPVAAAAESVKAAEEAAAKVPTSEEYRALLERRKASVRSVNVNIWQEVGKFEKATDEEKRELYNKVKELVR